jgi:hypothetical protein
MGPMGSGAREGQCDNLARRLARRMHLHMSTRRVRLTLLLVAATMAGGGGALAQRGRATADNLAATVACGAPRSLHDRLRGGRDCRRRFHQPAAISRGSQAIHEDYVPDGKTAVAIAEAVSRGQLGDAPLSKILPFEVHLDGEVWRVTSRIGLGGDAKGQGGFRGVTMDIRRDTGEIVFFGYYPFD